MKEEIDTQTRKDAGPPFALGGEAPVLSAWAAEERDRTWGREFTEAAGRARADIVRMAEDRELEAWGQFKVSSPMEWKLSARIWRTRDGYCPGRRRMA